MSEDDIEKKITSVKNRLDSERVTRFYVNEEQMSFGVKLNDGMGFEGNFIKDSNSMKFTGSEFSLLKEIIDNNENNLIKCANGYYTNGRDFEYFFYDLISLPWYLEKLPIEFQGLKKISENYEELMHDRIHAQLGYHYSQMYANVECEKNCSIKKPDLKIDSTNLEIKSLISPQENTSDSFIKFSLSFRNCITSAIEQVGTNGVIAVAPWSQIINNYFKTYFFGYYTPNVPEINAGNVIIVLDGGQPLQDFYLVFNTTNDSIAKIREFAEIGYKKLDPMTYLKQPRRVGIPVHKTGDLHTFSDIGWGFQVG